MRQTNKSKLKDATFTRLCLHMVQIAVKQTGCGDQLMLMIMFVWRSSGIL